jgi:CheY-like chemotaxis protein
MTSPPSFATILVVDDTNAVLTMTEAMLNRYGHTAITAPDGRTALDLLTIGNGLRVDLVLLDVVMKDMTGPETAEEIRRLRPGLPILFMTGFPEHSERLQLQNEPVIQKPFSSLTLIRKIRNILENPKAASAASE